MSSSLNGTYFLHNTGMESDIMVQDLLGACLTNQLNNLSY